MFEIFDFPNFQEQFSNAEIKCPFCGSPQSTGCNHHLLATSGRNFTEAHKRQGFVASGMKQKIFQKFTVDGSDALVKVISLIASESDLSIELKQRCPIRESARAQIFYCSSEEKSREICQSVISLLQLGELDCLSSQGAAGRTSESSERKRVTSSPFFEDNDDEVFAVETDLVDAEYYDEEAADSNAEKLAEMYDDIESYARSEESGWYYDDDNR